MNQPVFPRAYVHIRKNRLVYETIVRYTCTNTYTFTYYVCRDYFVLYAHDCLRMYMHVCGASNESVEAYFHTYVHVCMQHCTRYHDDNPFHGTSG